MSIFNSTQNNSLFSNNITQHNQKILFGAEENKNTNGEQKISFGFPPPNDNQSNSMNIFGAKISSSGNTDKNTNNDNKENSGNSNSLFGQKNSNNKGSIFGNLLSNNNNTPLLSLNLDNKKSNLFGSSNEGNDNTSLFANLKIDNNQSSLFNTSNTDNNQNPLFGKSNTENNQNTLFAKSNNDNNQNSLFGKINNDNNQNSLFGKINNDNNQNSLFGKINTDNNQNTLFGKSNTENNQNTLLGKTKADNNQSTLFGKSNNDNNQNTLFSKSNNDNNQNSLFSNFSTKNNKNTLFGKSNIDNNLSTSEPKTENENDKVFSIGSPLKKNINGTLFNNPKNENSNKDNKNILGFSFGNTNEKNDNDNKNEENNNKISLFNSGNQSNIKIEQKEKIDNNNKIDIKFGIKIENDNKNIEIKSDNKEEGLSGASIKKSKNYLFDLSTDLNKKLFSNNNDNENKQKKEEKNKKENEEGKEEEKEEKEKKIEDKKEINIDIQNKNENKFGTPKKENSKLNSFNFKPPQKIIDSNDNIISTSSKINKNINNLISSQRLEDNEQIQSALENLYVYDILSSNSISENAIKEKIKQNKIKKNKPINFKLSVQIEGISIMNGKELNMVSLSDETNSNLMKKVRLILKKKFKMEKEIEDFDIFLIKNGKKLPLNDRELIGNYVKNQDIIIVSLIHHSSGINEENTENEEESEYQEQDQDEKKKLCPKEKLPILKRKGYNMIPNECVIARMSIDEIKNVKNFAIYNENGKIEFDNIVSIFGVNFDKLFNIEHDLIEYEKGEWCHSPRGTNFNIPATITLYNIHSKINISNNNEKNQYLEFLKNKCHQNLNGKFLSYNFNTHELKYKIPYFY